MALLLLGKVLSLSDLSGILQKKSNNYPHEIEAARPKKNGQPIQVNISMPGTELIRLPIEVPCAPVVPVYPKGDQVADEVDPILPLN